MKLYLRLLSYLKPYWLQIVGAITAMVLFAALNVVVIPVAGQLSLAIADHNFGYLNILIGLAVLLFFLRGLLHYAQGYLMAFAGQRIVTDLRIRFFRHLQDLSLDFFSKWKSGEIYSRIINDIGVIQNYFVSSVTEAIPQSLTFLGVMIYLLYLNWRLTALAILLTPVFIITIQKFGREMRSVTSAAQQKAADVSSILQENLNGIRIVKSFTAEEQEIKRFQNEAERSFHLSMKQAQIDVTQQPIIGFMQVLAIVAMVWFGGLEVVSGRLVAVNLVAFFTGVMLLIDPILALSRINIALQRTLSATERIFEVINILPTIQDLPGARELPVIRGKVTFQNLTFSYGGRSAALQNINLVVEPGEMVALVGRSGAGKSTFVNLIPRFYDPTSGSIKIDGYDIREVTLQSLRRQMGIVPQEIQLFSGTVKDNIAYGKPTASDDKITSAARAANAHEFIEALPQGYRTQVGERGMELSQGQRQRIAIARAILRDPRILILDEATSALDSESEHLIQEALEKLMQGRTTFVIAHRLSTVHHADRLVVLDQGRIVETGNHRELLALNGLYHRLYDLQFQDA